MDRRGRDQIALGAGAAAAFLFAVALGAAVRRGDTSAVDKRARRLIHPKRNEKLTGVAKAITSAGSPHTHPFLAVALALMVRAARGRGGASILAASASATTLDKLSRLLVHQKRPPRAGKHRGNDKWGYPSGHTCAITAIGITTALELSGYVEDPIESAIWLSAACASMAMGWSRLYLDEHWIDDVAGGLSAGVAIALTASLVSEDRASQE